MVRAHLQDIQAQFLKGDFSGPPPIHGVDRAGLAALKADPPGRISINNREVAAGAEPSYRTARPDLVTAWQQWFDAELADHGRDAMAGHMDHPGHGHGGMTMKP
jgi:hypothetical protein